MHVRVQVQRAVCANVYYFRKCYKHGSPPNEHKVTASFGIHVVCPSVCPPTLTFSPHPRRRGPPPLYRLSPEQGLSPLCFLSPFRTILLLLGQLLQNYTMSVRVSDKRKKEVVKQVLKSLPPIPPPPPPPPPLARLRIEGGWEGRRKRRRTTE